MKVTIEVLAGAMHRDPRKEDIDMNIAALQRSIEGKKLCNDDILLIDTISILEGIKKELPSP